MRLTTVLNRYIKIISLCSFMFGYIASCAQETILVSATTNCTTCDGTATATTNISGNVTFQYFDSNQTLIFTETNNSGTSTITNLCPGVYLLETSNGTSSNSTYFSVSTQVTTNFDAIDTAICSNTSTFDLNTLIPAGVNTQGQWTNTQGNPFNGILTNRDIVPNNSGIYTYTLLEGGCEVTSAVALNINDPANPGLSTTYLICDNYDPFLMTLFLAGSPDMGGIWLNSNYNEVSGYFDPAIQGEELFTYLIDSVAGCSPVFSTLNIQINNFPNAGSLLNDSISICESGTPINLSSLLQGNPENGIWVNENSIEIDPLFDPSVNSPGVYSYIVEGTVPCPNASLDLTITYTDGVSAGIPTDSIACGDNTNFNLFDLLAGEVTAGGIWTNNSGLAVNNLIAANPNQSGEYNYSISIPGCASDEATVNILFSPPLSAGNDTLIYLCDIDSTYDLNNSHSSGAAPNGTWLLSSTPINQTVITLTPLTQQQYIYQIINEACPIDQATIEIIVEHFLYAGTDTLTTLCQSSENLILTDLLNNPSDDSGTWLFEDEIISPSIPLTDENEGEYTYKYDEQNACPSSEASIIINIIDSISFNPYTYTETCNNLEELILGDSQESNCSYIWSPNQYLSNDTISNPTLDLTLFSDSIYPIDLIYTINIQNEACSKTALQEVQIQTAPEITINTDYSGCEGEQVTLNAGNFTSVLWQPEEEFTDPTAQEQSLTFTDQQNIFLTVNNENNCSSSQEINLHTFPLPDASFALDKYEYCAPAHVHITNTSNNSSTTYYTWDFSNDYVPTENNFTLSYDNPTSFHFSLTAITENGCVRTVYSTEEVKIYNSPTALFSFDDQGITLFENTIDLNNSSHYAIDYQWTINGELFSEEEFPTLTLPQVANQNHQICLKAINNTCIDTTCKYIYIPMEQMIFVPNTFTPNNDNINDVFRPVLLEDNITSYSLKIFNRWGQVIFETTDPTQAWIGNTNKNSAYYAGNGVYTWQIKIKEKDILGEQQFSGTITLIR